MIGQTISHYKIIEKLGEGGMGIVYKALDLRLQRKVALKMLPASLASLTKSDRERFLLEAQATSSLDHPNICTVYEIDETPEGHAFIAMALYDGETLAQRIKRGALNHEEVLRIGAQVGLGLQAAHEEGIVHRDIKSSNIMLTKSGQVKIMDFGVAKYITGGGITQSGIRIGTLAYMSPEQAQGKGVDQRADIWSFGIVLHEMITGALPFDTSYEYGLLYSIIHDRPPVLSEHQPSVHPEFQSIVDKCLEKDPQRRYGTAAQVVDHILSVGALPPASSITGMRRIVQRGIRFVKMRWTATILLACFVVTGLVLYFLLRSIDFQRDVIVYKINYVAPKEGSPVVTEAVLDYLLRDELEQSSYKKIVTEGPFAKTYPGKTPAVKVTFDVRDYSSIVEIEMQVRSASALPWSRGAGFDTIYQFSEPSRLLKGITANIAAKVLGVAGIKKKKVSTFTPSWMAFQRFYEGEGAWHKLNATPAKRAFNQALQIDSNFVLARLRFAEVQWWLGAYAEAQANVNKIKTLLSMLSAADSLRGEALIARLNSDLLTNVDLLRELYDRKPYAAESAFSLAEGHYQLCSVEDARTYYDKALAIDSNYALAYNHLGYCYVNLGEHEKALAHFRKYISLDFTANSYDSYADGLFAAGYLDSAASAKEKGLSLDPTLYHLHRSLFYIRLYQGQLKKAEECVKNYRRNAIEKTLQAKAEYFDALLDYFRKRDADALKHCRAALSIFDGKDIATRDHELHWLLGLLYLRTGQQNLAKRELDDMEALVASNNVSASNYRRFLYKSMLHLRACLAAKKGDVRGVEKYADELEEIKTMVKDWTSPFDLSYFYNSLGEIYLEKPFERAEFAEEYFIKSLKYNPHFPFAHHQLWLLYQRQNKSEQAEVHFQELEKIWKNADPEWKAIYMPHR